jgi:hypothetical protein
MNLHDIRDRREDPNTALVRDFLAHYEYPQWNWRIVADRPTAVEYRVDSHSNWDILDERDTLTYTNRALDWDAQGRPQR